MMTSRRATGRSVSRRTVPTQRSMFSRPENSGQQTYAQSRQTSNYRYAANQVNPLAQNRGANGLTNQRQKAYGRSSFGGNNMPGQTQLRQPNSRMVNASTGRNMFSQQNNVGRRRGVGGRGGGRGPREGGRGGSQQMSMMDLNDFIRRQPGGKAFMEDNDRAQGGRYNFDQSLSRTGAGMARKNGALPPELQQMAIPFAPSKRAEQTRMKRQNSLQQSQQQSQRKPRTWYDGKQSQLIDHMMRQEREEVQQRTTVRREGREMDQAMQMGVRFQPSTTAKVQRDRQQQRWKQQPKQQQSEQQQQTEKVAVQQKIRGPPLVRAPQRAQQSRFKVADQQRLSTLQDETDHPSSSRLFLGKDDAQSHYAARTERPSRLFADNVNGIRQSVNASTFVTDNERGELPMVSVSRTRRKVLEREEHMVQVDEAHIGVSVIDVEKMRIEKQREAAEKERIAILKATGRTHLLKAEEKRLQDAEDAEQYEYAPKEGQSVEFITQPSAEDGAQGLSAIEQEKARLALLSQQEEQHRWNVMKETGRYNEAKAVEKRQMEELQDTTLQERHVHFADTNSDQYYGRPQDLQQEEHMMSEDQLMPESF